MQMHTAGAFDLLVTMRWPILVPLAALLAALLVPVARGKTGGAGIDVSEPLSASAWSCLAKSSLQWAVVRAWHSYGSFDTNAPATLAAASKAGQNTHRLDLSFQHSTQILQERLDSSSSVLAVAGVPTVDAYMFPCRGKPAASQTSELIAALANASFTTVWLDVEANNNLTPCL